jgi:hypothetical protein
LLKSSPDSITFSEFVFESAFGLSEYSPRLRKMYFSLASNNLKSAREFKPKPYAGDLLLVRPERKEHFGREPLDIGWGKVVQGSIKIVRTPVQHAFMVRERHVDKIVGPISDALRQIDACYGAQRYGDDPTDPAESLELEKDLCLEGAPG